MVYRIAQEALTNVAKHSKATHVDVIIEMHEGEFVLLVEDNGVGFDIESVMSDLDPEKRLGILGMTERANMAGGFLKLDSEKSEGTTVILRIPKRTHE
jgi:signal transduction histidine kinase